MPNENTMKQPENTINKGKIQSSAILAQAVFFSICIILTVAASMALHHSVAQMIERELDFAGENITRELAGKLERLQDSAISPTNTTLNEYVFDQGWLLRQGGLAHLVLYSQDLNKSVAEFKSPDFDTGTVEKLGHRYEFEAGTAKWEVQTTFFKSDHLVFLETLPVYLAAFGVAVAALGAYFLGLYIRRAGEMRTVHEMIQKKNEELQNEILERERLNEALRATEKQNSATINAVSDIIFETDGDGYITFLNAAWRKITGFEPQQSLGLELFKMLYPEDQARQRQDFELMVKGYKPPYRNFTRLRTADGSFRAVELSVSMIRHDASQALRVVGTLTDVEERRRAERALSEAEKKYRAIVENAAGGIFQVTPEGLYLSANPAMARILGYESPEALLRSVKNAHETVYIDVRARHNMLRQLEKDGVVTNYESLLKRKDGAHIWVNENIRVVRDEMGNALYYEGSLEDITQQKETLNALKDAKVHSDLASRAKSEFLANMSHELRTPLNAIIGFSEIIKNEAFGTIEPSIYKEYAQDIYASGRSLMDVITEILDISKIEAGERTLNESLVDVNEVADACLSMLQNKIRANEMTINNVLNGAPKLVAEELAVKQILMNLLTNAIKFTPSGGRIALSYELDRKGGLRVSITDTGIGLDEIEIKKALSPFGQVNNEFSRGHAGTGLGLTLVEALMKLHDGRLEMFSQKGIGTTATIIFPAERLNNQTGSSKAHKKQDEIL